MKHYLTLAIVVALLTTIMMPTARADALAKVDGFEVTEDLFSAFATGRVRKPVADLSPEERQQLSEELIRLVVIGSEARKKKVQNDPAVSAQLKLQEYSLLAQAFLQRHVTENPVSEAQMKALYDSKYGSQPQTEFKARHILVESPETAIQIIDELSGGGDFVELAAKYSTGPSAKSGGDLGWFTKQQMVPEFGNAVLEMSTGTYSKKPVQTQYGWHVIQKEGERETPAPELAAVSQELQRELQQNLVEDLINNLRQKAKVKTYQ